MPDVPAYKDLFIVECVVGADGVQRLYICGDDRSYGPGDFLGFEPVSQPLKTGHRDE